MCAVNKPPRPQGVKAWDIDRFEHNGDDFRVRGWCFDGNKDDYESYIREQIDSLPIIESDELVPLYIKGDLAAFIKRIEKVKVTPDPMNAYLESLK